MSLDEQIEFVACMAGWFPDDKLRQLADSLRELKRLRECVRVAGPHDDACNIRIKPLHYEGNAMDYCNCWKQDALKESPDE